MAPDSPPQAWAIGVPQTAPPPQDQGSGKGKGKGKARGKGAQRGTRRWARTEGNRAL